MKKRLIIWCEVSCRKCGKVANASGWYSPDTIRNLKKETKNWESNDLDYGIVCLDCSRQKNEKERF